VLYHNLTAPFTFAI